MIGIVQDKEYLRNLKLGKLENMLRNIHHIYYHLPERPEEHGLYDFVKSNILDYLGKAYEDNVEIEYDFYNRKDCVEIVYRKNFQITAPSPEAQEGQKEIALYLLSVPGKEDQLHYSFERFQLRLNDSEAGFPTEAKRFIREGDILKFSYLLNYKIEKSAPLKVEYCLVGCERKEKNMVNQMFRFPTRGFSLRITAHDFGDCRFDDHFSGPVPPKATQARRENRRFTLNYDG